MSKGQQNIRIQVVVTIIAVTLFAVKIVAWRMTNSVAIFTDAMESTINVLSGFIGLYSLYLSNQPRDTNHPYGHGKVEFISAGIEGTLICLAGLGIIYQAIHSLIHPPIIQKLDFGIILITITAAVNCIAGFIAVKIGKRNKSIALEASGKHLLSDTYSTMGIIVGLILMHLTGLQWIDSLCALTCGLLIIVTSYNILRSSAAGIMDKADTQLIGEIITFLNDHRRNNWIDMHNMRVIKYGSVLHLDLHMTVPWYLDIREAHIEQEILLQLLRQKYGAQIEVFCDVDPCQQFSCRICMKEECTVRQHPFKKKIEWTPENVMMNRKHTLEMNQS